MKILRLMAWVLGPILLSLPMMCMHAGDGHHTGYDSRYSSVPRKPSLSRSDATGADDTDTTRPCRYGRYLKTGTGALPNRAMLRASV